MGLVTTGCSLHHTKSCSQLPGPAFMRLACRRIYMTHLPLVLRVNCARGPIVFRSGRASYRYPDIALRNSTYAIAWPEYRGPCFNGSGRMDNKLLQILDSLSLQSHTHPFFHCFSLQSFFIKCNRWSVPLEYRPIKACAVLLLSYLA